MDSQVMPMYAGYAIGNIIKKDDLMLPILLKEKQFLDRELEDQTNAKSQIDKKDKSNQALLNTCNWEIKRIQARLSDVTSRIDTLYSMASLFSIQETLPIDANLVKTRTENNAFLSERMKHITFDSSVDDVRNKVKCFINDLFLEDTRSSYLPAGTLDSVVNNIESMTKTKVQVSLVGSFITLPRVRTIEPIVLRRNAIISDDLQAKANDYYVLTEAVLGAVFIAVGKSLTVSRSLVASTDRDTLSNISTISFISQGVIPRIAMSLEDVNVWTIYAQWKEDLKNEQSGYPIRFKFKELKNVLQESNLYPSQPQLALNEGTKTQGLLTNSSYSNCPSKTAPDMTTNKNTGNIKTTSKGNVEDIL